MRMRALLFLFAAATLFMSVPDRAYAHSNHHAHHHHVQVTATAVVDAVASTGAEASVFSQAISASEDSQQCPHGKKQADCGFCCACVASAAAVLAPSALQSWRQSGRAEHADFAVSFQVRQPVLDLSRPPKSFA